MPECRGQANGLLEESVVATMHTVGKALNDTFHDNDAGSIAYQSAKCGTGAVEVAPTGDFDFVMTMEDLTKGQRVGNYSIDYQLEGSSAWEVLVPAVQPLPPTPPPSRLGDRPDGHDPRDSHIGHKRIDVPVVVTTGKRIAKVRFNCIRLVAGVDAGDDDIHIRRFSLHKKVVPWE